MRLDSIAVFCGSSLGTDDQFRAAATELGVALGRRNIHLIYGGGTGLMQVLATAALQAGGSTTAIVPNLFRPHPGTLSGAGELIIVDSIHARKMAMSERADAFIGLPGGSGTLEELTEQWTWAQIGIHDKPSGLLNVGGFYDPFVAQIHNMRQWGFTKTRNAGMLVVEEEVSSLLDLLANYEHPKRLPSLP